MEMIPAKTLITKNKKPAQWFGAEYNMNIYRGCSYGCIYCDSRSECYRNPDFDTIKIKENALQIIRDDLRRKVQRGVISTGAMSDPYNSVEGEKALTRNALELINAFGFGVAIDTKGVMIERDIDILSDIRQHSPVIVKITITTSDDSVAKKIEPNAASSGERFETLRKLSDAGIFCGIIMMPILPFINDTEENIEGILRKAKDAGAKFVYPSFGVTLRSGNREYFYQKLDELFPSIKQKYIATYGTRYMCFSKNARKLWSLFEKLCKQYGLLYDMRSITAEYRRGYGFSQLSLLDFE
jgi:DNA repair photolyase